MLLQSCYGSDWGKGCWVCWHKGWMNPLHLQTYSSLTSGKGTVIWNQNQLWYLDFKKIGKRGEFNWKRKKGWSIEARDWRQTKGSWLWFSSGVFYQKCGWSPLISFNPSSWMLNPFFNSPSPNPHISCRIGVKCKRFRSKSHKGIHLPIRANILIKLSLGKKGLL